MGSQTKYSATHRSQQMSDGRQRQQRSKKQVQHPTRAGVAQNGQHALPASLQQSIVDVFTQAFPVISQQADFKRTMQEVKGHLYNRDFQSAFSKPEYLDVYASRWSAARALVYADIFTHPDRSEWLQPILTTTSQVFRDEEPILKVRHVSEDLFGIDNVSNTRIPAESVPASNSVQSNSPQNASVVNADNHSNSTPRIGVVPKVICIGGGAGAEIVGLAAARSYFSADNKLTNNDQSTPISADQFQLSIEAVDIADWTEPVRKISSALTTSPDISKYASQMTQQANRPLLDPQIHGTIDITFNHSDILQASLDSLIKQMRDVRLVTLMFTLNELFGSSLPKTTSLLLNLTEAMPRDSYLVVVDSPGSYSEIKLGKTDPKSGSNVKKYPMKWLLDHTLLEVAGKDEDARWTKIEDHDSRWFRIDEKMGLRYGVDLENCRYQIHVFEKVK